jgi:hypothetical protein
MATPQQKLPKGPSNSSGFGTPGTQQTAQKNVKTGGFDPNMPKGPQAARQARSSYQQSLGAPAGVPGAPATGYALFAGMPTQQATGLNRSLGLSNLGPMGGGTPPPQAPIRLPGTGGGPLPQLPPSGGQGATAPRGTAGVLQEEYVDALQRDPSVRAEQRAEALQPAERIDQGGWESAPLPLSLGRRPGSADVASADFLPSEQELATGEATTTEDMVWGMYSNGTMSAEEAQAALGMDGSEFAHWAVNKENQEKYGHLTDEEFALRQAQAVEDAKADARARLLAEGDRGEAAAYAGWTPGEAADPGAARGGRLEAGLADMERLGAPYVKDPDKSLAVATASALSEEHGYIDREVQKVKDNLAKQAEIAYQQNLDQLMRQFAVMGTAGSGAFMMANNNLAVQIYGKLLDEYAQIDLKNLDQIEIDLQQQVGNLSALAQVGYANQEDFLDSLEKIDKTLFMTFTGMLETISPDEAAQWMSALANYMSENLPAFMSGEMTQEEYMKGGMDLLNEAIAEAAEEEGSRFDGMKNSDFQKKESATPTPSPPSNVDPPMGSGLYDGQMSWGSDYLGDATLWQWDEESGEWMWYGLEKD